MSVAEALTMLGGVATRAQLVGLTSRVEVDAAVASGAVVVTARGRYCSPVVGDARRRAHRLSGTVGLLSAALAHGWAVKTEPPQPQVVVPRNRRVTIDQRRGIDVIKLDLAADDITGGVTSPDRTLLDVARRYPDDEVLCVFDSALRGGYPHRRLIALLRDAREPGAKRMRTLAARADGRAANPFETCTRTIVESVPGLEVRPQVPLHGARFLGQPDLVDVALRIIIEADSFEWHGGRAALVKDTRRYNAFVIHGWLVVRFAWEDVMFDPDYVRSVLVDLVAERTKMCRACGRAA